LRQNRGLPAVASTQDADEPTALLIASSVELGFGGQIQEMAAEGKFAPKIVGGLNDRFTHPNSKMATPDRLSEH
jgi:hypothetical protein